MAANIISRLVSRLNNVTASSTSGGYDKPDALTRDIGGQFRSNQPYISGYFQVMFGLPGGLFEDGRALETASRWLHSTCEGFTPHTQTLTKVDVMGQGQIGSSFVSNITTTREFTLTFREYQNLPILNIIRLWSSIFDPHTGTSPLPADGFIPANYKGWCAVMQTKPVRANGKNFSIESVEECYLYQGVFPTNIPIDTASASDIATNDTVQLSTTFSFDNAPLTSSEPGVTEKVLSLFNGMSYFGETFNKYNDIQVSPFSPALGGTTALQTGKVSKP